MSPTIQRLNRSAVLVAASLALTGCADPGRGAVDSGRLHAQYVDLPDGRVVTCVTGGRYTARSLDCDWANAALEGEAP